MKDSRTKKQQILDACKRGKTQKEVATLVGVSAVYVQQVLTEYLEETALPLEELDRIRAVLESGKYSSLPRAATALGLSKRALVRIIELYNLVYIPGDEYIGTTVGLWKIDKLIAGRSAHYECICLGCNRSYTVVKRNVLSGKSSGCMSCRCGANNKKRDKKI